MGKWGGKADRDNEGGIGMWKENEERYVDEGQGRLDVGKGWKSGVGRQGQGGRNLDVDGE